jgi:hypothetical protein
VAQGYDAALGAFGCQLSRLCGTFSALGTVALERKVSLHPRPSLLAPRLSPLAPPAPPPPYTPLPVLGATYIFFQCLRLCVHVHVGWVHEHVRWTTCLASLRAPCAGGGSGGRFDGPRARGSMCGGNTHT